MSRPATLALTRVGASSWWTQATLVLGASLLVALCARLTLPLPFTPVPLTLQNFGVLVVALTLGSRRGFAALTLYLVQGAAGLPVFNPAGPGGMAQLLGPTGGYLLAYPVVAFVAGWIAERGAKSFARLALAAIVGETVLFLGGLSWLLVVTAGALGTAAQFGLYPFLFAEVAKVMLAAGLAGRLPRMHRAA